ncbi:MAG: hypothetical protein VR64_17970 [Desulfatitalea sp. BRH_c12]|nr:MAG: hypothetical protein VR64_17970 [Desulfatitalea sp. BRH_c12]
MDSNRSSQKAFYLLLGLLLVSALFLLGATYENTNGRYRMSVITRGNFTDIFVIDTTTGVVKYVGKDEGKPFEEIKGK